jgi:tRNA-specific 2-thiouridylase
MVEDAKRICTELGIPHYTVNLVSEFDESVILPFIRSYAAGRTPNPCLDCNKAMKFGHLLYRAREIGATYIATGHYARTGRFVDGQWVDNVAGEVAPADRTLLLRGVDSSKDQSYALYSLTQDELAHSMFPLGGLTKKEVRRIAADSGLRTADKPESQEICFVTGGYRDFLTGRGIRVEPGPIVDTAGRVLGRHTGIPFYTVGQRHGLGVAGGEPLYVVDLDVLSNTVVVGKREEAYSAHKGKPGASDFLFQ